MALLTGISNNVIQVVISGARVAFDPRTTEEVLKSIDPTNRPRKRKAVFAKQASRNDLAGRNDLAEVA